MDFVDTSIFTHIMTFYILLVIIVFNLYSVITVDNYTYLRNRLKVQTPLFHFINACMAYTGMIVSGFTHDVSPTVIVMISTTIAVMVLEIKRYKKMRVIKSTDIQKQEEFRLFAQKIYKIEIAILIFTFIISKLF